MTHLACALVLWLAVSAALFFVVLREERRLRARLAYSLGWPLVVPFAALALVAEGV